MFILLYPPIICLIIFLLSSTNGYANNNIVIGKNEHFVVLYVRKYQSLQQLSAQYLGDSSLTWIIEKANNVRRISKDQEIIIPLKTIPGQFSPSGYQVVPMLIYHRFGKDANKMTVTPKAFEAHLQLLNRQGYTVIPLLHLQGFLLGKKILPEKAVVITIDDGYQSVYHLALPLIEKYQIPVTLFLYSDYINQGGLTPQQIKALKSTGLISIQAHSKTHANLSHKHPKESQQAYLKRLKLEIEYPKHFIHQKLGGSIDSFAYPFGDFNRQVVDQVKRSNYQLGLTVSSGENTIFTSPWVLRRKQVLGNYDLAHFTALLTTYHDSSNSL